MGRNSYKVPMSWDPGSSVTSGFFNCHSDGHYSNTLLLRLRGPGIQARHPISIIIAILDLHTNTFRDDVRLGVFEVYNVECSLGLNSSDSVGNDRSPQPPPDYSVAHARLVNAFATCHSYDYSFVSASTAFVTSLFDTLPLPPGEQDRSSIAVLLRESRIRLDNIQTTLKYNKADVDSVSRRIDLAMRVVSRLLLISGKIAHSQSIQLYNMTQRKDSEVQRSIALDSRSSQKPAYETALQ